MTNKVHLTRKGVEQLLGTLKISVNFWLGEGVLDCEVTIQDTVIVCEHCEVVASSDLIRAKHRLLAKALSTFANSEQIETIIEEQ